ncbi:DNA polymerase sliding clamp subunit [Halovivax ruber XH-70]|uniref:DNA polymerase sliding clamp n=2 Tax=Halovivax ruber TaxID=387341 RepID=L0I9S7_HALRX|nr:DNA polymerase sliding clamp subunit [Halovivax ruber XH-70]
MTRMTNANDAGSAVSGAGSNGGRNLSDAAIVARVDAGTLSTVIDALSALVTECRLEFDDDGLSVIATDPAVVASVSVDLAAGAFETYDGANGTFGLDVERLGTIVGLADRDRPVTLAVDAGTRHLHVGIGELRYEMGLLDPETIRSPPDPTELRFEYGGGAVLPSATVDRFVGATDLVANHLSIALADEALRIEADGDVDAVSLEFEATDLQAFTPGEARSLYSLEYLRDMSRAIPGDAAVDLRIGTETPISLGFEIADGDGSVEYVLSPRIARE